MKIAGPTLNGLSMTYSHSQGSRIRPPGCRICILLERGALE